MYVQAVVATVKAPDNLLEHVREIRRVNQLAMPDGEVLADECLMTRKEAKENLLKAMSNFYDLERSAGLSVEKVNKEILTLAQENQKNKTQQAAR